MFLTACVPATDAGAAWPLKLASSTESKVTVDISIERAATGGFVLAATFTPAAGFHLYSKDLPRGGVDGLGCPTLLELVAGTRLEAAGELTESVSAMQAEGPDGLWIYPAGPVTLRLAVALPAGSGWFDDQVAVTYMACSGSICSPPVIAKPVSLRVPGAKEVEP